MDAEPVKQSQESIEPKAIAIGGEGAKAIEVGEKNGALKAILIVARFVTVGVGILSYFNPKAIENFRSFLIEVLGNVWTNSICVFAVLLLGIALYYIRQSFRTTYGVFEIIFALVYAWFSFNKVVDGHSYVESLSIIAAVYLVVRGCG